jgi:ABC-type spermidine/putrescine transport system permease subunit I
LATEATAQSTLPDRPRWSRGTAWAKRQLLVLPSAGWTLLFFLVPLGIMVVYSFGQRDVVSLKLYWGWTIQNYVDIVDSIYLNSIVRSVVLSLTATALCLVIGFPVAYYISRQAPRRQHLLLVAIMIPFWTSFLVRTYAWVNLLANQGLLQRAGEKLGVIHGTLDILYTPTAIGIGLVYSYLPLMVFPLYVALERIDPALREAASDLGARRRRVFLRVTLPLAMPGVIAGCIIVGIPATGEYVVPAILGGGKTLMFGNVVASQFFEVGNFPFGAALAVSLMTAMTVVLVLSRRRAATLEDVV